MKCVFKSYNHKIKSERGAFFIELAILFLLLVTIFSISYELTQLLRAKHLVSQLAYEIATTVSQETELFNKARTESNIDTLLSSSDVSTDPNLNTIIRGLARLSSVSDTKVAITIYDYESTPWESAVCGDGASLESANCGDGTSGTFQRKVTVDTLNANTALRPTARTRLLIVELVSSQKQVSLLKALGTVARETVIF